MKKLFIFLTLTTLLSGCILNTKNTNTTDSDSNAESSSTVSLSALKAAIIQGEQQKLPLFLQEHNAVHSVVIDSVVIISTEFPAEGYIATTWNFDEKQDITTEQWAANGYKDKYIRKTKTVYVKLSMIVALGGHYKWFANWDSAFNDVKDNKRR